MPRKCIAIAVPTFGMVSTHWAMAFRRLQSPMNAQLPHIIRYKMEIGEARNSIVTEVLTDYPDTSHIFFLDDDVLPHAAVMLQLLSSGKPITCGVYYLKCEFPIPLIFKAPGEGLEDYVPGSGLIKVHSASGGLSMIETEVFRHMAKTLNLGTDRHGNTAWFRTMGEVPLEPSCSEDSYFFLKAHEAGVECWSDTSPFAFGWHWDYAEETGYPAEQWNQYVETGKATWKLPVPRIEDGKEYDHITIKFR